MKKEEMIKLTVAIRSEDSVDFAKGMVEFPEEAKVIEDVESLDLQGEGAPEWETSFRLMKALGFDRSKPFYCHSVVPFGHLDKVDTIESAREINKEFHLDIKVEKKVGEDFTLYAVYDIIADAYLTGFAEVFIQ